MHVIEGRYYEGKHCPFLPHPIMSLLYQIAYLDDNWRGYGESKISDKQLLRYSGQAHRVEYADWRKKTLLGLLVWLLLCVELYMCEI